MGIRRMGFRGGIIVLAGICSVVTMGCVASTASEPIDRPADHPQSSQKVAFDAAVNEDDAASELVAVVATNGRSGYAYRGQLEHVEAEVTNPSGAVAYMERLQLQSDEALAQQLTERLPDGVDVTLDKVNRLLDITVRSAPTDLREGDYATAWEQGLAELSETLDIPEDELRPILRDAYWAANEAVAERIPVYEADGETQIGEFALGGLAKTWRSFPQR